MINSQNSVTNQTCDNRDTSDKKTYPLVDVEDIVKALQTLGQVDNIHHGILSLQRAPDKLCALDCPKINVQSLVANISDKT